MSNLKTIFIYTPTWLAFGGGEKYVLLLAEVLSKLSNVSVTLLSDKLAVTRSALEEFSHADLSKIDYRNITGINAIKPLTRDTDIFISLSNFQRIQSVARTHVQLLQIPYGKINASSISVKLVQGKFKEAVKDLYRLRLLSFSRDEADLVITNSKFVSDTLQQNFGIQSQVLFPPIQDYFCEGISKKNIILSAGRFFCGLYNNKRYDILTEAFRRVCQSGLKGWEYHIVGSVTNDSKTQQFLQLLREQNRGYPIYFHVNENYDTLRRLYNEATIFWHGAGYGVDEYSHPENVEHFGMTTVEAMSACCIPVVSNRGGQKEIITHGINGYLWETVEDLINYSEEIARSMKPLTSIWKQTRERYQDFELSQFRSRVQEILSPLLNNCSF
jgi:glycosyltransferase involved in cell wall biosynthesis